jgi:hypothetical protein
MAGRKSAWIDCHRASKQEHTLDFLFFFPPLLPNDGMLIFVGVPILFGSFTST